MKQRYIQHPVTLELIPAEEYISPRESASAMVMPDIAPYVSQADGRVINSRSVHREHLRQHGLIEVGNEWNKKDTRDRLLGKSIPKLPGAKEAVARAYYQLKEQYRGR